MTSVRITPWIAAMGLAVSTLGLSPAAAATWYALQEIPLPPGAVSLQTSDISDGGEVVGMVEFASGSAGFAYLGGSLTLLAAPVDHVVWGAWAVNGAGQIVGGTVSEFGIPKSALWSSASDPAPVVLESGGGPDANVYTTGINSTGVISGYYTGSGSGNTSSWRAVIAASLANGWVITSTATRESSGSTSEFSACVTLSAGPVLGDIDGDGDVDLADYAAWEGCLTGPIGPVRSGCTSADLDADDDVDTADYAAFQML